MFWGVNSHRLVHLQKGGINLQIKDYRVPSLSGLVRGQTAKACLTLAWEVGCSFHVKQKVEEFAQKRGTGERALTHL